jgi:two-component system chemotaxis response regulator CheB
VVQHIASGFTTALVEWLNNTSALPIHVCEHGEKVRSGQVYLAPDDKHMKIDWSGRILLKASGAQGGPCPSADVLFRSVADVHGPRTAAVLLTGMGKDGASALKVLKEMGAVTIAQDEESSIVHGMPGEAVRLGAARYVLSPQQIATKLGELVRLRRPV